jgi:hypothetical protein
MQTACLVAAEEHAHYKTIDIKTFVRILQSLPRWTQYPIRADSAMPGSLLGRNRSATTAGAFILGFLRFGLPFHGMPVQAENGRRLNANSNKAEHDCYGRSQKQSDLLSNSLLPLPNPKLICDFLVLLRIVQETYRSYKQTSQIHRS